MQIWDGTLGRTITLPDSSPVVIAYDPRLPYAERGAGANAGCPPGYFTQWRSDGWGGTVKVCRLMDVRIMTTTDLMQEETGIPWTEYAVVYGDALYEAVRGAPGALLGGITTGLSWLPWVLAGLVAVVLWRK